MSDKFFQYDNSVMRGLSALGDLLLLNLIFLLGCIPIITIGVSVTAMYYTLFRIKRNEESPLWRMFWHSYRDNLCQGILIEFLFTAAGLILFFDFRIISSPQFSFGNLWYTITAALIIIYQFSLLFVFPLLARFRNSVFYMIRNAFLIAMMHPLQSLLMLILNMIPFVLFWVSPILFLGTGVFWLTMGFSGIAWICAGHMEKIFKQFMPDENS